MRWVKDGPDIPVEIVQAVEEGRLVFFCGAGVSQQSGLPNFQGLVEAVYTKLRRQRDSFPLEEKAFKDQDYDQVFASLEAAIKEPGLIRRHVAEALELAADADTSTHGALLKLATDRGGKCRLVTTNYDRGFSRHLDTGLRVDAAPRLPVPTPSRWNSVVHLHGFLDDCGADMRELVLSSADFGAAYLVDGWATRFLRELFQHFIVLFAGYKADDLVVKYMLQALAVGLAERGEKPRAFALAQVEETEQSTTVTWEAKGIRPVLYPKGDSHDGLHATLRAWAENASLGLLGRRNIVAERLRQPPPPDHDEVVDQVLWALQDESGATAKYLAEHESPPSPRHWLSVLDENKLLMLGNVPLVGQVGAVPNSRPIHPVTLNLARWLARHLHEASVLDWALGKGASLHQQFRWLVRDALKRQEAACPPEIEKAWTFLARQQPDPDRSGFGDPFALVRRIESGAWDLQLKSEIAAIVAPYFVLMRDHAKEIIRNVAQIESEGYPLKVDVRFAEGQEAEYVLDSIRKRPDRDSLLTALLDDCTLYLRRAMEIQEYFGSVSAEQDWTYIWVRSIGTSISGHHRRSLVALITLTGECIDSASRADRLLARSQADYWKTINFPIFRRLVCFAMTRPNLFTPAEAFAYISGRDLVFWHHSCQNEFRELLAHIWPALGLEQSLSLTERILAGPPPQFYRADLSAEDLAAASADSIRDRLAVLAATGPPLPPAAAAFLSEMEHARSSERVSSLSEEGSIGDLTTSEVAEALRNGFPPNGPCQGQWMEMVSNEWPRAVGVLCRLADLGSWPTDVWAASLGQAVTLMSSGGEPEGVLPVLDLVLAAPNSVIAEALHSVTLVLHFLPALRNPSGDDLYWRLWDRAFEAARQEAETGGPSVESMEVAMNTPVGRLTQELFEWAGRRLEVGTAEPFWVRLDLACTSALNSGKAARAFAASNTAWLFGSRPEWTSVKLLPYFDWDHPEEAKLVWKGFTFGATFSPALWSVLKKDFLATFENIEELDGEAVRAFYQTLGRIAIHEPTWLTNDEAQRIVTRAPHIGREQIAWVFWTDLDAAGDKAGPLWRDRIGPWLAACWQPDEALKAPETSLSLIRVALSARDAVPEAVDAVAPRMSALDRAESAIFLMAQSKAPEQFPQPIVKLLDRAVNRSQTFYKGHLESLLTRIAGAWPEARRDPRFSHLSDFAAT
jgi:hypothetical protein